ncbi:hypothetical protein, partial [Paenibacillus odorifer]|uniref:hypothetical protein n=1 Tax=Paenibacillus odorifer TaxID=189426 RepID=UPI001C4C1493
ATGSVSAKTPSPRGAYGPSTITPNTSSGAYGPSTITPNTSSGDFGIGHDNTACILKRFQLSHVIPNTSSDA